MRATTMDQRNDNDDEQEQLSLNPYLALRAAKIARNQARLKELGLVKYEPPSFKLLPKSKARSLNHETNGEVVVARSQPSTRRSQRLRQDEKSKRQKTSASQILLEPPGEESKSPLPTLPVRLRSSNKTVVTRKPLHPKSVRNISIHVNGLVLGNKEFPNGILGLRMALPGKAFCLETAAQRSGAEFTEGLSFNKYSGIQEWKNDALFLWVNLGGSNEVVNEFLDGGRKMTWYGGSRHHDETSIILRLLKVGQQAAQGKLPGENGIVLWCRQYDAAKRAWSPYICLGRLAYHSHEQGSRPLRFVMSLLDFDRLNQHAVRQTFHDAVATAS